MDFAPEALRNGPWHPQTSGTPKKRPLHPNDRYIPMTVNHTNTHSNTRSAHSYILAPREALRYFIDIGLKLSATDGGEKNKIFLRPLLFPAIM